MDSKTKIVVLHTKELIYTAVFALLCILLIVLLFVMFGPGHTDKKQTAHKQYTPGTYTSTLTLNNTNLEVEVSVDSSRINSIRFANLDETVTTMFPLIQPAIEEIADQIYDTQSLDAVELSDDAPYNSKCHPAGRRKSRSQQNCGFLHIFDCLLPFHDQIAST